MMPPNLRVPYDSRPETWEHIRKVRFNIDRVCTLLFSRGDAHDSSKLVDPELAAWDLATPRLRNLVYGSDEYRSSLRELKESGALEHHFENNSHHPEHYPNGVHDMTLLDIIEMLCDWKAASERTRQPDQDDSAMTFAQGLVHNHDRFGYSEGFHRLIVRSAREFDFITEAEMNELLDS